MGEQKQRLDSWKEIAQYLGRDVRTVIRWEKEKRLPVYRIPGGQRAGVYSYREEIDEWMQGQGEALPELAATNRVRPFPVPRGASRRMRGFRLGVVLSIALALAVVIVVTANWTDQPPSAAASPARLQRPLRFARADYEANQPRGLVAGDFNGDKKLDLAFTDSLKGSVVALLGDGYGVFTQRVVSPAGMKSPEHIALGDFNGDGRPDVVITSYVGGRGIEVLLGKGDGSFLRHFQYDVGGRSRWVAVGDVNGDGKLDLVVAASATAQVIVLFGNGDGRFHEGGRYEAERDVAALALADLNGDGTLDIVANDYRSARGRSVSVYFNRGDGTFPTRESFPAGDGPLGLAVADLNQDGRLDVITANFPTGGAILYGNGASGFAEPVIFNAGQGNGFAEAADLDRDGALDLVILGEHSNTASVLLGDGRGGFLPAQDIPTGEYPDGVVLADFDNDRKLDMAILNINGNSISVYLNRAERVSPRRWYARLISRPAN